MYIATSISIILIVFFFYSQQTCQNLGLSEQILCPDSRGTHTERHSGGVSSRAAHHSDGVRGRHREDLALEHLPTRDDAKLWPGEGVVYRPPAGIQRRRHWLRRGECHDQGGWKLCCINNKVF